MGLEAVDIGFLLTVGAAWLLGTFGGGWLLAKLWKRLHPTLSFYKLWAFWAGILNGVVALLLIFGIARL